MERKTRSMRLKVVEDKVDLTTVASINVLSQQSFKDSKRKVAYSQKRDIINPIKELETSKSARKVAPRRTLEITDRGSKTISKASAIGIIPADDDASGGKPVLSHGKSNSRVRREISQNKEKGVLSKAVINDPSTNLTVSESLTLDYPEAVKSLILQNIDKKSAVLGQSLSPTSHVSDKNVLCQDYSTRSPTNEEDSFLYDITSRSPAKLVPRNEDSVGALETDSNMLHEFALPEEIDKCHKQRELSTQVISRSRNNSLEECNRNLPVNIHIKSPAKADNYHPTKVSSQQGLGSSLQKRKTEKTQMLKIPSTKPPHNSQNSAKRHVSKTKDSASICSPSKSSSTHSTQCKATKANSDSAATISQRKVVTKLKTKPNLLTSSADVFTRLSMGTPRNRSYPSNTNNSTIQDSKARQLRSSTSSVSRDNNISSLNFNRSSKEGCAGTPLQQSAAQSNEAKAPNLQKPKFASKYVKTSVKRVPSKSIPAPHPIQSSKRHQNNKPLEDIESNLLPRVNSAQDIKSGVEAKINNVLLVRAEAAERGRQAIKEWAEKQMAKK